ncbi:MAG: NACHT domain-containing protein, partial [Acidobacteria bacterium]|nr:NACHT domain-containing protein [Acidobacteriota bacterium]
QSIYIMGHPCGLPLKYAPGGKIGEITNSHFLAGLDVYSGNSGSPVFCAETHELVGIVSRGKATDFRWTEEGWITLRYPKNDINYKGTLCTRVSNFIKTIQLFQKEEEKIENNTPKRINININSSNHCNLTLYKEIMIVRGDSTQKINSSTIPEESSLFTKIRKNIPIEWENGGTIQLKVPQEILIIQPSREIDFNACGVSIQSSINVSVISSTTDCLWKIRFPSKDAPETQALVTINLEIFPKKIESNSYEQESPAFLEDELRNVVAEGEYDAAEQYLRKIIKLFPVKQESLEQEFGFIYNWKQKEAQVNWREKVWQILAAKCNFELITSNESVTQVNPKDKIISDADKEKKSKNDAKTPKVKGDELEQAVFKLFNHFLEICEKDKPFSLSNARQQDSGRQSGHDLKFVCEIKGNRKLRFLIECKNYSNKITLDHIAGKLLAVEAYHKNIPIDHWILVSPNVNVSNELEELIELWEEKGKYPFKVQIWTPATQVKEFFGLIPAIYDSIITKPDLEIHPKDWNEEKRKHVIDFWNEKLNPPLRLPQGWGQYLRKPEKFRRQDESLELENLCDCHVPMNCLDDTGTQILGRTLEDKIMEWLEKPVKDHPTLLLLGDFGDGKTTFCYILSRKLAEQFRNSPSTGWLPVRFFLKDFSIKNINTSREFLRRRLEEIGVDINGWDTLAKSKFKLLAILDGFDEMSKKIDPKTILDNIEQMIECYQNEFSYIKVLITSRKHFFENRQQKNQLLQRIGNPQILMLAPIKRITTEEHLRKFAKGIGEEDKFNILIKRHDPIGLASKPLFLEMLKATLKKLPNQDLDELTLYETYISLSLERKGEYLDDEKLETSPEIIIENLKEILENVSIKLHQSEGEFIYLSDIHGAQQLINRLWNMSNPIDCTGDDEMGRIAVRSLLRRVMTGQEDESKQWPVDFCHRSMREYFVARAVCKMMEQNLDQAKQFLRSCRLSYEIIFFAAKMMKKNQSFDYTVNLRKLIMGAKYNSINEKIKAGYIGC